VMSTGANKLPLDLRHHQKMLDKLMAVPGEQYEEQRLAITRDFQPTGFFDNDVWFRAVLDYMKVQGPVATIID